MTLLDAARIGGDVDVWLGDPNDLEQAPGAQIAGELRTHERHRARRATWSATATRGSGRCTRVGFVAAFLFGLLVYALAPRLLRLRARAPRASSSARSAGLRRAGGDAGRAACWWR